MTIVSAAIPSVSSFPSDEDVTIQVTFRLSDPLGTTDVVIDPEPSDGRQVAHVVSAATARLIAFRDGYLEAEDEDAEPTVLPVPWYAWGH